MIAKSDEQRMPLHGCLVARGDCGRKATFGRRSEGMDQSVSREQLRNLAKAKLDHPGQMSRNGAHARIIHPYPLTISNEVRLLYSTQVPTIQALYFVAYRRTDSTFFPRIFGVLKSHNSQSSSETNRPNLSSHFFGNR